MAAQRTRVLLLQLVASAFFACGEDVTPNPGGDGGTGPGMSGSSGAAGTASGNGGTGAGAAGGMSGGASASGGAGAGTSGAGGSAAGAAGMAGAGTSGSAGGAGASSGGTSAGASGASGSAGASAGTSGAAGSAGASGASGTVGASGASGSAGASAGTSGAAGAGGGLASIAEAIHEFRLEAPCSDADHFGSAEPDNCDVEPDVDRQTFQRTIAGSDATTYDVKLRVRGLTEPNIYTDGMLTPPRFYVGGRTTQPGYTSYSLTVADPPQVYFFNHNDSVGHFVFPLDYEVVIPMRGGTIVTFDINGQNSVPDGHGVSNRDEVVIEGVSPAPAPFNGQFVQFDVVDVTARN